MVDTEEKYFPHQIAWIVLNRLQEFDEKPEIIQELTEKFEHLTGHTIYYKFAPMYREGVNYFQEQGHFPDLDYLNSRFPDGRMILYMPHALLSSAMVDKLNKTLDYEILIQDFNYRIGESETIDIEGMREFSQKFADFAEHCQEIPQDTKDEWLDSYETFVEEFHGISTGNKILDEQIGTLGGLVTIAAPSSNGKSTFALSLAYNIATQKSERTGMGGNVLYISYEMTKFQLQAGIVSIESSFSGMEAPKLKASDIKEAALSADGRQLYKEYISNFMARLNYSGGYLKLVDNTAMTGNNTIEGFMSQIEKISEELNRKFDIIFIDNVDSLNIFKGERGQDEMAKMNSFITKLDAFSKTYMNGYGTTIVLLSQTNREGFKKLKAMESNGSEEITIDFTVLQRYSALYERACTVLVLYSSALMRANHQLKVMPVKLRNKPLPRLPLTLAAKWEYSYIGSGYKPPSITGDDLSTLIDKYDEIEDNYDIDDNMVTGDITEDEPEQSDDRKEEIPWDEDEDIPPLE